MKLTDGVTEVSGMEYRHINCLNSTIPPGCKVREKLISLLLFLLTNIILSR